jgi:hypothetical protein
MPMHLVMDNINAVEMNADEAGYIITDSDIGTHYKMPPLFC